MEKNTKKAINETIEKINEIKKGNFIQRIDATQLKDLDKIALLVSYSLYLFRNIRPKQVELLFIDLSTDFSKEITEEHRHQFSTLKSMGGGELDYAKFTEVDFVAINLILHEKMDHYLREIEQINRMYQGYIDKEKNVVNLKVRDYQRKLNFHNFTYHLGLLYDKAFDKMRILLQPESCLNPNPSFQRDLVWDIEKKQRLIESILNEIPIGAFYINVPEDYKKATELCEGYGSLLWDGKQRLHAINSFYRDEFPVTIHHQECYYSDAPSFFNHKIRGSSVSVYESNFNTLEEIVEAYVVINKALVKHTDEDLKKAERYLLEKIK